MSLPAYLRVLFTLNPGSNMAVMFKTHPRNPSNIHMIGKAKVHIYSPHRGLALGRFLQVESSVPVAFSKKFAFLTISFLGTVPDAIFSPDGDELYVSINGVPLTPGISHYFLAFQLLQY
ncbi:hypothetical protein FRC10_002846 [Ceratobasidium sp. 414]|nr:hypothetical protein FRC10_002846 [Ceratobasidium sp. 414]